MCGPPLGQSDRVPAPPQLVAALQQNAEQGLKDLARETVRGAGKQLGLGQAQQAAQAVLKRMNIPSLPVQLPSSLTAEGVADAAYRTGKGYVENLMRQKTGLPIELPRKLSLGELERSVTGLLPANAREAMELGLAIGTQYAASAVTSLLVGAGIGSVIPGLGTIVGIGMALGVQALRGALEGKPQPYARECKTQPPAAFCRFPPLAPIDLVPWIATAQASVDGMLADEQRKSFCGRGPLVECSAVLGTVGREAVRFTRSTVPVLNLPQLQRLVPMYERAPTTRRTYDHRTGKIVSAPSETQRDLTEILPAMHRRYAQLVSIAQRSARLATLPMAQVAQLRWELVREIGNAAQQYQNDPTPENQQWLALVAHSIRAVEQREQAHRVEMKRRQEEGQRLYQQRMQKPSERTAHERQILQFQCSEGNQAACKKLRAMSSPAPAAPARAPTAAPRAPARGVSPVLQQRCQQLAAQLFARYPQQARCFTPAERARVVELCLDAYARKTITPQQALASVTQMAAQACARRA